MIVVLIRIFETKAFFDVEDFVFLDHYELKTAVVYDNGNQLQPEGLPCPISLCLLERRMG